MMNMGGGWIGPNGNDWQFVLGIGMTCAVTALPILVLFMEKLSILREPLGQRTLRYASLDDVAIWGVLALILLDWERVGRQAGFLIAFAVFPEGRWPFVLIMLVSGALAALVYRRATSRKGILQATFIVMIGGGLVLNGHFYPNLLHYQANAKAGQWAAQMELGPDRFFGLQVSGTAMDYYAGYPVPWLSDAREARLVLAPGVVVYTDAPHRKELIDAGLVPEREVHLENFPAQRLSFRFLDTRTRAGVLEDRFLLLY